MRTISITIQEALYDKLKYSVPARKISKFVSGYFKGANTKGKRANAYLSLCGKRP